MARGFKTGGRQRGTPNRQTLAIEEKLAALKCDPLVAMAKLALDTSLDPALRARMFAELSQYLYPKRRAVESVVELRKPEVDVLSGEALRERLEAALRSRMGSEYAGVRSRKVEDPGLVTATSTRTLT